MSEPFSYFYFRFSYIYEMKLVERITIVAATDNHYCVLLAALIKSIEVNYNSKKPIDFYIVGDGLTESNVNSLVKSYSSELLTLHWLKMENIIPPDLTIPFDYSSYPKNIYVRLFIPYFLPETVSKAIYLDVDMIVQCDIHELWTVELHENIVGAVVDPLDTIGNPYSGIPNYKELQLNPSAKYFNTGLLLMNVTHWRNENITAKVLNCVAENKKFAKLPDQYALNVVLYDRWLELEKTWNTFSNSEDDKANIIHFAHRKPIYKSYHYGGSHKNIFFHYLNMTDWKGFKEISEVRRYAKKLYNLFEKVR